MKIRTITLGIVLHLFSLPLLATGSTIDLKLLMKVNEQWTKQTDALKWINDAPLCCNSFNECISAHLILVEKTLRHRDVSNLSASQKNNRARMLDELSTYAQSGVFPVNDYLLYKNPVFIDRKGTHCAVGYLMMQSGHDDLAQRIDKAEKFAFVKDIRTPGVAEWADEHGFRVDELAWIQPGYPPQFDAQDLDKGVNGTVHAMVVDNTNQTLYAAGNFSQTTSGVQAYNVAMWYSGFSGWDWMSLGSGTNGTVRALLLHNNKLYAGGDFTQAGGVSAGHVAVYDLTTGQWQSLGSLDSSVYALAVYKNEIYAGGRFTGFFSKWNGNAWVDIAQGFLYGEGVRALEVWNDHLVIGGNFELATGALRRHVALYDMFMGPSGMGTVTPVNDFEFHNGKLYAACDAVNGTDTCALAAFNEVDLNWEIMVSTSQSMLDGFWGNSINKLLSVNNQLYCAGDFNCSSMLTYGSHLMTFERVMSSGTYYNQYSPLLTADSSILTLAAGNNSIYFGGNFKTNQYTDTLNGVGFLEYTPSGIGQAIVPSGSISVYPNPASDVLNVEATLAPIQQLVITDVLGKVQKQIASNTEKATVPVADLLPGVYMVRAKIAGRWVTHRFVRN